MSTPPSLRGPNLLKRAARRTFDVLTSRSRPIRYLRYIIAVTVILNYSLIYVHNNRPRNPKRELGRRSFEEPDFGLLSAKQPHEIGCDVPLEGDPGAGDEAGKLVFIGIFSTTRHKSLERRELIRKLIVPDLPPELVTYKFIIALPELSFHPFERETYEQLWVMSELRKEQRKYGDIALLDTYDNMDWGKTHEFYRWAAKEFAGTGRVKGRPRFVGKFDDDTIIVAPNFLAGLKELDCSKNVYHGTSSGSAGHLGPYFRGLGYTMSWPLAAWIGSAEMPPYHTWNAEDARTGQWLRNLDPETDPVVRVDMGWSMQDWTQLVDRIETVALHLCKEPHWFTGEYERVRRIWRDAGREYNVENGLSLNETVSKGREQSPWANTWAGN